MNPRFSFAVMTWLVIASPLSAATFSVTTTNDNGAGSLRQAIIDANASAGADAIAFNIASGGLTISISNALPSILDPLTIDGSTQPGFAGSPIIELNGVAAGAATDGLKIATSNSVIRALIINRFLGDGIEITNGRNNTVAGCYLGLNRTGLTDQGNTLNGILITNAANNTIGGLVATNRNYIAGNNQSGVHLGGSAATNNVLLGNFIGLNINGAAIVNSVDGVRVNAPQNIIGGSAAGSRNVISGNTGQGIEITAAGAGTIVRGNYIGTDATGTVDRGNSLDGILISAPGVIIGGSSAGAGNLISGNNGDGIELTGASATNALVVGNIIGASSSGTSALVNNGSGVFITTSARNNFIGGVLAGEANTIAFNGADGISVAAAVANTNNAFRANAIFSNAGLGIDLGTSGVTANDVGDADTGANQLQNFPILTSVSNTTTTVTISGNLNSRPSTTYTLDFYSSPVAGNTGYGEGRFYLGSSTGATGTDSNLTFTVNFAVALQGRYVTVTATDPFGNTSEFSAAAVSQTLVPGQMFTVINTNDSGAGSLREAINQANLAVTAHDTIVFAITNLGTTISPASPLPTIADSVTIDGYTQSGAAVNTSSTAFNGAVPVRISGTSAGTGANGLLITAGDSIVRGLMITGFNGDGIELAGFGGNVIEGCVIGLNAAGADLGNAGNGVLISGSANNAIGGTALAARNVISGNTSEGIEISGASAVNNLVQGNLIGTTYSGTTALANGGSGVLITTSSRSNIIGGMLTGQANLIAYNSLAGISVAAAAANTNNTLRGNTIFSNGGLGIDLGAAGVTLNDANDADTGANQLQNFPVLTSVTTNSPTAVTVTGSLNSAANTTYVVDFHANAVLDVSGYGEGQFYLGSTNLTTDGSGNASFEISLATALPGRYVSATATDPFGNTSEFSRWAVAVTSNPSTNVSFLAADFVFIIDASVSMAGEIAAVKAGLGSFVTSLNTASIDARFAVVLFGGPTELILDWTTDQATTEAAFDVISVNGAVPGIHNNHNLNPEAGLEAIRIVLNGANNSTLQRNNVGGSGPLAFRPDARKNLVLVTDENSDLPYYVENREVGQTGTEPPSPLNAAWQAEIDTTAQVVISNNAFLNLLISPAGIIRNQYGGPAQSVSDANFLNYNPEATLSNLITAGFGESLEAQVLAAGLIGRAFNITSVNTTNFIQNFFAAKVEEIINNPPPRPRLNIALLPAGLGAVPLSGAVRLTWTTNSPGYALQTNHSLALTNGWGILTTNYSISGTNYVVTNAITDTIRFYRLRK